MEKHKDSLLKGRMIENEQKTEFIEHCIHYQKSQKESQKSRILSETFHMDAFNVDIHFGTQFPTYWEGMSHGLYMPHSWGNFR